MKNFLRALRHAWPYRRRLILSMIFALCAAVMWGLNLTSIYPVLKLLHSDQSPQQWVDQCIANIQEEITDHENKSDSLTDKIKEVEKLPASKYREQVIRDFDTDLAKLASKLEPARRRLLRYKFAQKYIHAYCPADCYKTLAMVVGLVVIGVGIKCIFEFLQESLVGTVVNRSLFDLRNRFYRNVIHLDVNQFSEQGTSEMMARFTNDMESLGTGQKTLFGKVVAEPLRALSCVVLGCFISWQLTLMFLILVPIAAFVLSKVGRIMKQATRRLLERMSSIYKILQESFQGIRVVKAFTMEPYERRRFYSATKDYCRKSIQVTNIDAMAGPIIELLGVAAVAGALLAGSYLVLHHETQLFGMRMSSQPLEPESLLQLYILLAAIADPVRKLSSVFTRIQSAWAASDRIFAFLDRQPRVHPTTDGPRVVKVGDGPTLRVQPAGKGTWEAEEDGKNWGSLTALTEARIRPFLEFRDVCFSYEPDRPLLTDLNFTVKQGETIAVVGHNGCGKTTLMGLLPRFFDPDHGSILLLGHDLRTLHVRSLRQQIGIVTQDTVLFEDTIGNNIAYGTRGATPEQIEQAARRAYAHDFITRLPRGYDTRLAEAGSKVSGGEGQRLTLARAILRNPGILILDEFTSKYDSESEALVHKAMREFMVGRTSFVITHRLHTLELADRIIVLEQGRIAAVGTHQELMASCQPYQRLHEAYAKRMCA